MSDPQVKVTITEQPVSVTINDGTPIVTITDSQTNQVTIIDKSPQVLVDSGGVPKVTVLLGGGRGPVWLPGQTYDVNQILDMMEGSITQTHLDAVLSDDIEHAQDIWTRLGNEVLLTYQQGLDIEQSALTHTDQEIATLVLDVEVVDGKVDIQQSTITQHANTIDSHVQHFEAVDESIIVQNSRILQTEESITSTVEDLRSLDGPGGSIELAQSAIIQNADNIIIKTQEIEQVGSDLIDSNTEIALTKDTLALTVTKTNTLTDRVDAAEIVINETSVIVGVTSQSLLNAEYELSAIETLMANQYTVNISEDVGGNKYATGFQLALHPLWLVGQDYVVDETIFYDDKVWKCILDHTASLLNNPVSPDWDTYWVEIVNGVKSEFSVWAESFKVQGPNGPQPVFVVDTDTGVVRVNGSLVVTALESDQYGEAGEPWFKLDPTTGIAEFNNMLMTFTSSGKTAAQTALNVADGSDNTANSLTGQLALSNAINLLGADAGPDQEGFGMYEYVYMARVSLVDLGLHVGDTISLGGYLKSGNGVDAIRWRIAFRGAGDSAEGSFNSGYVSSTEYEYQSIENKVIPAGTEKILFYANNPDYTEPHYSKEVMFVKGPEAAPFNQSPSGLADTAEANALNATQAWSAEGATNDSNIRPIGDTTTIDGGKINASSEITIGNIVDGNYTLLSPLYGVSSYYWDSIREIHLLYNSLTRSEEGSAIDEEVVYIPGLFVEEPRVDVTPKSLQSFVYAWLTYQVDQVQQCDALDITEFNPYSTATPKAELAGSMRWRFTNKAKIIASSSATWSDTLADGSTILDDSENYYWEKKELGISFCGWATSPANTTKLYLSGRVELDSGGTLDPPIGGAVQSEVWIEIYVQVTSGDIVGTPHLIDSYYVNYGLYGGVYSTVRNFTNKLVTLSANTQTFRVFATFWHQPATYNVKRIIWQKSVSNVTATYAFTLDDEAAAGTTKWTATGK